MLAIQCLYLEDEDDTRKRFTNYIKMGWDEQNTGVEIEILPEGNPDKAMSILRENPNRFNLFVVDLLFKKEGKEEQETLGITAISEAKKINKDLAIVALSVADQRIEKNARDAGADEFASKAVFLDTGDYLYLGEKLLSALHKKNFELAPTDLKSLKVDEDNLPLTVLIDNIGRENIINFVYRIIGSCKSIRPFYVRSGLSGASVLRAECDLNIEEGQPPEVKNLLLKISRDRETLQNELKKDTSHFPEDLFIKFIVKEPIRSGNWYSLASNFKNKSKTLLDWLLSETVSSDDVDKTLTKLFIGLELNDVYSNIGRLDKKRPNVLLWETLSNSRRARIRKTLDDFHRLTTKYDSQKLFDIKLIEAFLFSKRICDIDEENVPQGSSICWSHGDFHGRNILIKISGAQSTPFLIDPANIIKAHWASDVARLIVDLIVSGLDSGDSSYEWENMDQWVEFISKFIQKDMTLATVGDGNRNILTAVSWIRDNIKDIHNIQPNNFKPEWEFELALAVEFLRAAYREQDLPAPKRVLGLIGACEALRKTKKSFDEFRALTP